MLNNKLPQQTIPRDKYTYCGMKINRKIGMVVNISAQNQSRVAQKTIGRMHKPVVHPIHCIMLM